MQDIFILAVELVINIIEDKGMVQQEETMNIHVLRRLNSKGDRFM